MFDKMALAFSKSLEVIILVLRQVHFLGEPDNGQLFLVHGPNIVVHNREKHKAVRVFS